MAASTYEPTIFEVSVSAGMGAGFGAALAGGRLRYSPRGDDQSHEEVSVAPTSAQWRSFRRTVDRLDAWAWHGRYEPPSGGMATDGVDWQIAVAYADGAAIRCAGYNAYPPHGDWPEFSAPFRAFCRAVSRLLGGLEFGWVVANARTPKGSQLRIRQWVHEHREQLELELCRQVPSLANFVLEPGSSIKWLAPGPEGEEIRDGLWPLVLPGPTPQQDGFWPAGGPVWDAAAIVGSRGDDSPGIVLVEAKAHVAELLSPRMSSSSYEVDQQRRAALDEAKLVYKIDPYVSWIGTYYQLANRLAFLYYLRVRRGRPAWLINVYFCGDSFHSGGKAVVGPKDAAGWADAVADAKRALGLGADHPLRDDVADVFLPAQAPAPAPLKREQTTRRYRTG